MKIIGIIAEYNPFHNGHNYHIQESKHRFGADAVIVVMSGDFVQRGEPAIVDKYVRTEMALSSGADLVLELPVRYAVGSAEYFASGAICLLSSLNVVDAVCFGSECGSIEPLKHIGSILANESQELSALISSFTNQGELYPIARKKALELCYPTLCDHGVLNSPNNILGIEYCKAIVKQHSDIVPLTILRNGADYHQMDLSDSFSSASAIRKVLRSGDISSLSNQIPAKAWQILSLSLEQGKTIDICDFFLLLKYKLMNETVESLTCYQDVSEDLAHKILRNLYTSHTFEELILSLKTKDIAYTRISRALLHILLNIQNVHTITTPYARVLGFRKNSSSVLKEIKAHSSIPLITKLADRGNILADDALQMINEDIWCANLYETVRSHQTHLTIPHEIRRSPMIYQ